MNKNKDQSSTTPSQPHSVPSDVQNPVQNGARHPQPHVPQNKVGPVKKSVEMLSSSKEKLRLVINAALDAVICIDIN